MNQKQKKRLLNVAKALRESKEPKAFDMMMWDHRDEYSDAFSCGAPACALGHYASRTDLQRLMYLASPDDDDDSGSVCRLRSGTKTANRDWATSGPDEARTHFGITEDEWHDLFSSDGCGGAKTAKQAAKFIERFVAKKEKDAARR